MNGADHYRAAEHLLADVFGASGTCRPDDRLDANRLAGAQVHALLALAAAQAAVVVEDFAAAAWAEAIQ